MKKNAAKGYEKTNPKQTQFPKWPKRTQISLSQRIMKMNHLQAPKKQSQNKPNFKPGDGFSVYYARNYRPETA